MTAGEVEKLLPITQDVCPFYEDHELFDDYTGVVTDIEEGKRIATTLGSHRCSCWPRRPAPLC